MPLDLLALPYITLRNFSSLCLSDVGRVEARSLGRSPCRLLDFEQLATYAASSASLLA